MAALMNYINSPLKAIENLSFSHCQAPGAATVGLTGTAGAITAGLISTLTHPLVAGTICGYASVITVVAMGILRAEEGLKVIGFIALPIASTLLLSVAATNMGFPVSISLALILSVTNVATIVLGIDFFNRHI